VVSSGGKGTELAGGDLFLQKDQVGGAHGERLLIQLIDNLSPLIPGKSTATKGSY
jgi:hypothetical protein